jgi:predicted metal-dependent phosphoesterase TrpH
MGFDLHCHSFYSDGALAPEQLVAAAADLGLKGIALTDHDCVDGLEEALQAARRLNFLLIPGIELTTDFGAVEAHILGYRLDFQAPALRQKLDRILAARQERAMAMLQRLQRYRVALEWNEVKSLATSRFIGRAQVFKAMELKGYVDRLRRRESFEYYLGKHGVAYVPHREIETREAIELILAHGGTPVLAHPGRMNSDATLAKLVAYGLRGLEVYYPSHTPEMVKRYLKVAKRFKLVITGGSDYHGKPSHPELGASQAPRLEV